MKKTFRIAFVALFLIVLPYLYNQDKIQFFEKTQEGNNDVTANSSFFSKSEGKIRGKERKCMDPFACIIEDRVLEYIDYNSFEMVNNDLEIAKDKNGYYLGAVDKVDFVFDREVKTKEGEIIDAETLEKIDGSIHLFKNKGKIFCGYLNYGIKSLKNIGDYKEPFSFNKISSISKSGNVGESTSAYILNGDFYSTCNKIEEKSGSNIIEIQPKHRVTYVITEKGIYEYGDKVNSINDILLKVGNRELYYNFIEEQIITSGSKGAILMLEEYKSSTEN